MPGRSSLVLIAFLAGFGVACAEATGGSEPPASTPTVAPNLPPTYNPVQSLAPLIENLQPAVVNIYVEQKVAVQPMQMPPGFERFFGMPPGASPDGEDGQQYRTQEGQGSGFLISADGYILTNNHVVADADKVKVRLSDERELDAKVIGTDDRTDVALVKVDTKDTLPFVKLGSSDAMRVGDWVVAIGNPYGLSHTVTAGIVSAKGRVIGAGPYDDFIQTDASINPGNSGGPLFNLAGEVVGINSAIVRQANSIGFAIPVDLVKSMIEDLKDDGHVARGWMGMGLQPLDADLASALKLDPDTKGAVISQVYPGFPASDAGLQSSDVITGLDGEPMKSTEQLIRAIGQKKPGETVKVSVLRGGKEKSFKVTLAERPDEEALARGKFTPEQDNKDSKGAKDKAQTARTPLASLGLTLESASRVGMAGVDGLVVTGVQNDSPADDKLAAGDVVLEINQTPVKTVEDANRALGQGGDVALFVVSREHSQRLVAVPRKAE